MARSFPFESLKEEYRQKYDNMVINGNRISAAKASAKKINNGKEVYKRIEQQTNVPWYFIGMLHLRESNCNFNTHLHNGDPLSAKTKQVPRGRPLKGTPPFSFEFSACDALEYEGYSKIKDWSIPRIAYASEKYNGWGYRYRGTPSAYLWAGSNQYKSGKFIRDGVFNPNVVDTQLGCMVVLKYLLQNYVDEDIVQIEVTPTITEEPKLSPKAEIPPPTNEEMNKTSRKHWWTTLLQWLGLGGLGGTSMFKAGESSGIDEVKTFALTVKEIFTYVGVIGLMILFAGVVGYAIYMKFLMKQDVKEGRSTPSGKVEE